MARLASTLNDMDFSTGKELHQHAMTLLQQIRETEDMQTSRPEEYRFMWALLRRHPDQQRKRLGHVKRVAVRRNALGTSEQSFIVWLCYCDGIADDDISLHKCCFPGRRYTGDKSCRPCTAHAFDGPCFTDTDFE